MTSPDQQQNAANPALAAGMTAAYLSSVKLLRDRLASTVTSLFDSGSYRDTDANAYVELMTPVAAASQQTMGTVTAAYLAHQVQMMTGEAVTAPAIPPEAMTSLALRGVDAAELLRRPYQQVWTALAQGKTLEQAAAIGRRRALDNSLTDLQLARTRAAQTVLRDNHRVIGYRRVLTGPHSCALCVVASTHIYKRGDLMPIHPGCVPGGSLVRVPTAVSGVPGEITASEILAVSRRWYSGELVVLTMDGGEQVSVTPNHPVLTNQGWLPAHLVGVGDSVFRGCNGHRVVKRGPDEQQAPAPIEDIWAAERMTGDFFVVPLAPEDFHADATQGEVEIIRTHRYLSSIRDVELIQVGSKSGLVTGQSGGFSLNPACSFAFFSEASSFPAHSLMGGSCLASPLLGSHFAGSQKTSGAAVTRFDAPREQFSVQSAASYASRGMDLIGRLAGQIEPHRVIKTDRVSFTGHVYNLHTSQGFYESNSHIVSNCDCAIEPLVAGQTVSDLPLEQVHEAIRRDLGAQYVSPDARRGIDYRKVLVTHEHGEIGPVLGVRGQHFTGPSQIPGD